MENGILKPRILVVDDDAAIRRLLMRVLSQVGYSVTTATNGKEALVAIAQQRPDLLLLDLMMPVMDGWEVYRRLQADGYPELPIIVLTAGERLDRARRDLPLAQVIGKPFDLEELVEAIEDHCSRHALRAERGAQQEHRRAGQEALAFDD
jgi:CheY-like chemotaxis protein